MNTDDLDHYQSAIHEIANKVDNLVRDERVRGRFIEHIEQFCKMVEDFGQLMKAFEKQLKEAEQKEKLNKTFRPLTEEICPIPKGWVKVPSDNIRYDQFAFIKVDPFITVQPKEPPNPILWFGYGNATIQSNPTDNELLMCDYVLLACIHDMELRMPTDKRIFPDKYNGELFDRDLFREEEWKKYYFSYSTGLDTPKEKQTYLERVFCNVQADCTKQKAAHSKWRKIINWFKNHPHNYGLTGGVIFLILFLVLGLVKTQWRNWCWGTAGIALLVLILSLLGGRSRQ